MCVCVRACMRACVCVCVEGVKVQIRRMCTMGCATYIMCVLCVQHATFGDLHYYSAGDDIVHVLKSLIIIIIIFIHIQ